MPDVQVPGGPSGSMPAYLAEPVVTSDRPGPWPGVVVIHDAIGMSDEFRLQADWLAAAGYIAVTPNLFTRGSRLRCVQAAIRQLRDGSGDVFEDVGRARGWLVERSDCTGVTGVIGFCMGGGFALLLAPRPGWSATSVNYGPLPDDLDDALAGACPIVASYGGADRSLRGAAQKLESALTAAGVPHDVKEYPGAGHVFMNREAVLSPLNLLMRVAGVGYRHPDAEDARRRILAFFDTHLRRAAL